MSFSFILLLIFLLIFELPEGSLDHPVDLAMSSFVLIPTFESNIDGTNVSLVSNCEEQAQNYRLLSFVTLN